MSNSKRLIYRLEESVVNRIAAGEVLQRPCNAIKELIENSHDAHATSISVQVTDGGLANITVTDNGTGIQVEDFPVLCERFATSKLKKFEDLLTISTFGFRGEALASISQVAQVTVVSRTASSKYAYKAFFLDGRMSPLPGLANDEPIVCAGQPGTCISIDSLFYNLPTRRNAFKGDDEYQKILSVCQKYAIVWNNVSFTCQKYGKAADFVLNELYPTKLERIKAIYGNELTKNLIPVQIENETFSFSGFVSSLSSGHQSYVGKRYDFVLFVNERLVECPRMKKAIGLVYEMFLMKKSFPFFFGELKLPSAMVDVNVHPTKNEIFFLNEEDIIASISRCLEESLRTSQYERSFFVPVIKNSQEITSSPTGTVLARTPTQNSPSSMASQNTPSRMVRTDCREIKLNCFLSPKMQNSQQIVVTKLNEEVKSQKIEAANDLESIFNLRGKIASEIDSNFENFLSEAVLVGIIDNENCLFQKGTSLNLMKYRVFMNEFFIFRILEQFGIFEYFYESKRIVKKRHFEEIDNLQADIKCSEINSNIQSYDNLQNNEKLQISTLDNLLTMFDLNLEIEQFENVIDMLKDYFGIEIFLDSIKIPTVLENVQFTNVSFDNCISLIREIINLIDWDNEEKSLKNIAERLASFISHKITSESFSEIVFNQLKLCSFSTEIHSKSENIQKLTDLHDLYKVFERC